MSTFVGSQYKIQVGGVISSLIYCSTIADCTLVAPELKIGEFEPEITFPAKRTCSLLRLLPVLPRKRVRNGLKRKRSCSHLKKKPHGSGLPLRTNLAPWGMGSHLAS